MNAVAEPAVETFIDRRNYAAGTDSPSRERRQFTNSHEGLSPDARELAHAEAYVGRHPDKVKAYQNLLWALLNAKEFQFNY